MSKVIFLIATLTIVWGKPQQFHDPSLAKIIEEQRFNVANSQFGHAAHQEDGVIIREESKEGNNRVGAYQYVGDDGKTYTVRYEAGVNGFRILSGDHIPSGGQTAADASQLNDDDDDDYVYEYQYYDDTPLESPFVNPHDPTHHQPSLLRGDLAGHLAGLYVEPSTTPAPAVVPHGFQTPRPDATQRFFPPGELKFDRFSNGFNFKFRSNKK